MNTTQRDMVSPEHTTATRAALLASTLLAAGDGVIVTDPQGRIELMNLAAEQLIGIGSAAAAGRDLQELLRLEESDGRPVSGNLVELAIMSGAPLSLGKNLVFTPESGPARQVEGEIGVCSDGESVAGAVVTFRDVTARNWEELQRREEQKMRAIGQLAGAVAHDLNSLLTIIIGHTEAVEDLYPGLGPLLAGTAEIRRAAGEIATITRQLLAFSGREVRFPRAANLNLLLEDAKPKLKELLPPGIEITMSLEPELGTVLVDVAQMERAVLDLICYSRDRMPAGGRIELATANVILDENCRARHLTRKVKLTVTDSGPSLKGIEAEKLFEPAWTKGQGRSSTLSLYTIRSVLNAAEGHLSVESDRKAGATFAILLPQIVAETTEPESAGMAEQSQSQPTLLLVEDDDGIRVLLRNSLETRGYHVLEARDGAEGMLQATLFEGAIDMMITDVVMPVMDGPTMARNLESTRPGIKVLFISGCPEDLTDLQQLVDGGAHYVQKPFSQRDLLARVDRILGGQK
jgi:two-component system cell cycle sensor histidine kinase/response regulator CckA